MFASSANRRTRQGEIRELTVIIKMLKNNGARWVPCEILDVELILLC